MPSPVDPGLGVDISTASGSGPPSSTPRYKFFLKIVAKKDCTETMLKSLISRTHVPKPESYTLKQNDRNTECFLKYPAMEVVQEVLSKISAEKVNGAAFDTEALEVEPQADDDESNDGNSSPKKPSVGESSNDHGTVLRSLPPPPQQLRQGGDQNRRNLDSTNPGLQPRDCCYQFNNDGCSMDSPHSNNDPTRSPDMVHHFCKICLRKNLKKVHGAKACKAGTAPQ